MRLLRDACKNAGMAAMVVTHDAQLASWADRVVFLRDGQVTGQNGPAVGSGVAARARGTRDEPHGGAGNRQPPPRVPDGGVPARRAVIRWAIRLLRREWRQQLLLLALITAAVGATVVASTVATDPRAR